MEYRLIEIAERLRGLRDIFNISEQEMAEKTGISVDEYILIEKGENDFPFSFIYRCAEIFGVDVIEILTGETPNLNFYTITRNEKGLPIQRRKGFEYRHLAPHFTGKKIEPFIVKAPFFEDEQDKPISLSKHDGQEFDLVLRGTLKVAMEDHIEYLNEGDSILYNSSHGHGMVASGGNECVFLAIVIKDDNKNNK